MKIRALILIITSAIFTGCAGQSTQQSPIYGLWQYPDTIVFIQINEDNSTYQCRIAADLSVITAHGNFDGVSKIRWSPLRIIADSGEPVDSNGFDWGIEGIVLNGDRLAITGNYGTFEFERSNAEIPFACPP